MNTSTKSTPFTADNVDVLDSWIPTRVDNGQVFYTALSYAWDFRHDVSPETSNNNNIKIEKQDLSASWPSDSFLDPLMPLTHDALSSSFLPSLTSSECGSSTATEADYNGYGTPHTTTGHAETDTKYEFYRSFDDSDFNPVSDFAETCTTAAYMSLPWAGPGSLDVPITSPSYVDHVMSKSYSDYNLREMSVPLQPCKWPSTTSTEPFEGQRARAWSSPTWSLSGYRHLPKTASAPTGVSKVPIAKTKRIIIPVDDRLEAKHKCLHCNRVFRHLKDWKRHSAKHAGGSDVKWYYCHEPGCNRSREPTNGGKLHGFDRKDKRAEHEKIHPNIPKCKKCK